MALAVLALLSACQEPPSEPLVTSTSPIIQNQQLRYPADHPQLLLLTTTPATRAQDMAVELPARFVWNEEKTQRIYPAFAGRVTHIKADIGHPSLVPPKRTPRVPESMPNWPKKLWPDSANCLTPASWPAKTWNRPRPRPPEPKPK